MGLRPAHRDESPLLAPTDSKWFMRDFRRRAMAMACLHQPPPSVSNDLYMGVIAMKTTFLAVERQIELEDEALREAALCRAYELYELRGKENRHELEDWLQAESELVWPVLELEQAVGTSK